MFDPSQGEAFESRRCMLRATPSQRIARSDLEWQILLGQRLRWSKWSLATPQQIERRISVRQSSEKNKPAMWIAVASLETARPKRRYFYVTKYWEWGARRLAELARAENGEWLAAWPPRKAAGLLNADVSLLSTSTARLVRHRPRAPCASRGR